MKKPVPSTMLFYFIIALLIASSGCRQKAEEYINKGIAKYTLQDYRGAISDYTKAIELDPYYAMAYCGRGTAKYNLQDYKGAITDYTKAVELDPNYAIAYCDRGAAKSIL